MTHLMKSLGLLVVGLACATSWAREFEGGRHIDGQRVCCGCRTGEFRDTRVAIMHSSALGADGKIYFGGFGVRNYTGGGLGWPMRWRNLPACVCSDKIERQAGCLPHFWP